MDSAHHEILSGPITHLRRLAWLTATLCLLAASGRSLAAATGPDEFGYTAGVIPVSFEDLTEPQFSATQVLDNTDDSTVTIPIGFSFFFYGVRYTSVSVSTNGLITFGGADNDWTPVDVAKDGPFANLPSIAVFWHDWTFQYFGSNDVLYQTLGVPGSRRLVIQWDAVQSSVGPGSDVVTFEAKLFEGSNNIEFHYDDATVDDDATNSNGKNAAVGIRDITGQTSKRNLSWAFNVGVIADDSAVRFSAPTFKITAITRLTNKHAVLTGTGAPSVVHMIQVSSTPDPASFAKLVNVTADAMGKFQYDDAAAAGAGVTSRFYRLAIP